MFQFVVIGGCSVVIHSPESHHQQNSTAFASIGGYYAECMDDDRS